MVYFPGEKKNKIDGKSQIHSYTFTQSQTIRTFPAAFSSCTFPSAAAAIACRSECWAAGILLRKLLSEQALGPDVERHSIHEESANKLKMTASLIMDLY